MSIHILNKDHGEPSAGKVLSEAIKHFQYKNKRRHELWILSCYIDLNLIEDYVGHLLKEIRITDVYLAFNFSEIYKTSPMETKEKLMSTQENLKKLNINFEWMTLNHSKLMHSKGYAIFQRVDQKIKDGVVFITSANFTKPGFKGGNIEIGYISKNKKDTKDFEEKYNYMWDKIGSDINTPIFKQKDLLFKFSLLSSGVFIHKWSGNLKQQIGIKYELTEKAKKKGSIAPELENIGFEAGDTFTRQVLDLSKLPEKEVPVLFIKRFTIETYWGRWCPSDAWNKLRNTFEGSEKFIKEFQSAAEPKALQEIKREAHLVQKKLVSEGWIKKVNEDHLDRWEHKIKDLSSNSKLLERFFTGYEVHKLPYSIEQKNEINDLFKSIEETIELSKSKNIAQKKIISSIKNTHLKDIKITQEENNIIDKMCVKTETSKP